MFFLLLLAIYFIAVCAFCMRFVAIIYAIFKYEVQRVQKQVEELPAPRHFHRHRLAIK
jgi:hypothetical protein